ncbi:MAG: MBL fold metallo-hydrolase [Gammaproteobacteria bacterium]|nr:MBL fold metallo-hydrolase [Gammaproteobacteria bacterium]
MRITTLVENRPSPDDPALEAEWGLSQHVEIGGRRLLLDMGASDAFARNADRLGIDIALVDAAVLSHHHADHGGGLRRFFELNDHAPVYLGPPPAGEPTGRLFGLVSKRIGLDSRLMDEHATRFKVVQDRTEILPGVFVLPNIGGHHPRPSGNRVLFVRTGKGYVPDDFRHEVVVALMERDELAVLTGCSHSGVLNMVEKVRQEFPGVPIRAVVGGFHLVALPPFNRMSDRESDVAALGRKILDLGVETAWTGHCTGDKAFAVLHSAMGARVKELRTGSRLEL